MKWNPIFLLLVLAIACQERTMESAVLKVEQDGPDLESWDIQLNVLKSSIPRYHISAGYQAQFERGDSSYSLLMPEKNGVGEPVEIILFDENGEESGRLTAMEVLYYDRRGSIEAKTNVKLLGKEKKELNSELLLWNEDTRKVSTSGFVTINSPSEKLQGYDLVANEDLSNVEIKNLTGIVRLSN